MSGGAAGSQGADGGHGGHRCAAETGHGLRQLAGHLSGRRVAEKMLQDCDSAMQQGCAGFDIYHMRAIAGRFVCLWGSGGLAGQGRGGTTGIYALFFLSTVAEPDPDHLLLHVELFCDQQDFL